MFARFSLWGAGLVTALALAVAHSAVAGPISLEWRPASQTVTVGSVVDVGLYAVSDDGDDAAIAVMDVILNWDETYLQLQGVNDNGPYVWLSSSFPAAAPGGLNPDHTDGDALYTARSKFPPDPPGYATAAGLLVTTMQFLALAETPGTVLSIPEDDPGGAETVVVGMISGLDIHSNLGSANIRIVPEPAMLSLTLLSIALVGAGRAAHRRA